MASVARILITGGTFDIGVDAKIAHHLHASADHPVLPGFSEGAYLKGLVVRMGL